ncbi:MAG: short-chain dehydrogenase [Verrucomicrobiales bacterium]|nr:short-chain dehydrogenase [Verrucomicrobiales bacterium]|tara:strand:- start:5092 stop:5889 length:798 start_codon:yes stop_codon:yes gene_type:complete
MDLKLVGKTALVTGGAKGIGEATCRLLAHEGVNVSIVDRDAQAGAKLGDELEKQGMPALFVEADLSDPANCEKAVKQTVSHFGNLDIVVNNAGVNDGVGLDRSPADFMASLQLNLSHVYAITHYAQNALKTDTGVVINVSSKVSVTGQGSTSGYAAAKGAINALTREWAIALAPDGVRVNCVVPAECDTPQYENWFKTLPNPEETRAAIERLIPLGNRMTSKEELAAMIVFLASPASAHTTGQIVFVDGGYTHLDRAFSHAHDKW